MIYLKSKNASEKVSEGMIAKGGISILKFLLMVVNIYVSSVGINFPP
jgi:hypothetical protein